MQKLLLITLLVASAAAWCTVPWLTLNMAVCLVGMPLCETPYNTAEKIFCPIVTGSAWVEEQIWGLFWSIVTPMLAGYNLSCTDINTYGAQYVQASYTQCAYLL